MAFPLTTDVHTGFNFTAWAEAATNLTHFAPSIRDLLLAGPRAGSKLASFLTGIPEVVDNAWTDHFAQTTLPGAIGIVPDAATTDSMMNSAIQVGSDVLGDDGTASMAARFTVESARSFGNIFSYSTSRWALACIIMAIVLNRTHIYASPRRNLRLGWKTRFVMRAIPLYLFAIQARLLLQSIQCQTSPQFPLMRWGNSSKSSDFLFAQHSGALHTLSSNLLWGSSDLDSCRSVQMVPERVEERATGVRELRGSLSRLWPLFQTLCLSQFVETMSCALQGRQLAMETGMTLFEHSLAFAEAEAAVSSSLGWGPFGERSSQPQSAREGKMAELAITRPMIMSRVNTPAEVLLVGLLSSMNHLTSHVLGVLDYQGRLRLVSTAFWGLCFMSAIAFSLVNFTVDDLANQSLLRFPTVAIIGFVPHVMVLIGIMLCSVIYGSALLVTACALPGNVSFTAKAFGRRLMSAHENMQANITLSNIRLSMHMDFYQALLKVGYNALTMASEAVYLNESPEVKILRRTWLEEERLREMEGQGVRFLAPGFRNFGEAVDDVGLSVVNNDSVAYHGSKSGYHRERTTTKGKMRTSERSRDGVGASERSGRWIMVVEFFLSIGRLFAEVVKTGSMRVLNLMGFHRLRWYRWLTGKQKPGSPTARSGQQQRDDLDFWLVDDSGVIRLPHADEDIDIEDEMRRRLRTEKTLWEPSDEQLLEKNLYGWWLNGGWWGGTDSSGEFEPGSCERDEDNTSLISISSGIDDTEDSDWESDFADGQRTPTQNSRHLSRESTPTADIPYSNADLAALLHPRTPEQRSEAQALAAHLSSDTILTRSKFRTLSKQQRMRILTSSRHVPYDNQPASDTLLPEEEAEILEQLITSRRNLPANEQILSNKSWSQESSGSAEGSPQCVVCQSAPRTIIVWPCRCLSLCDDCRVTLAMNNFDKCVCCRRSVGSFSKVFVP